MRTQHPRSPEALTFEHRVRQLLTPLSDAKRNLDAELRALRADSAPSPLEGIELGSFQLRTRASDNLAQRAEFGQRAQGILEKRGLNASIETSEATPVEQTGLEVSKEEFEAIKARLKSELRERRGRSSRGEHVSGFRHYYLRDDALRTLADGTLLVDALREWLGSQVNGAEIHASFVSPDLLAEELKGLEEGTPEWILARIRQAGNCSSGWSSFATDHSLTQLAFPDPTHPENHKLVAQPLRDWGKDFGHPNAWVFQVKKDGVQFACQARTGEGGKKGLVGVEWTKSGGADYLTPAGRMSSGGIVPVTLFDPSLLYAVSEAR